MSDKCPDNCPLEPRVKALEDENKGHTETHKELFNRVRTLETSDAVQNAHYEAIDAKLDELTVMVKELKDKPTKRWDGLVDKAIWAVAAAVIAFLLGRIGL